MARRSASLVAATLLAACGFISGCGTGDAQLDAVRADPTPELDTLYQRPVEVDNKLTVAADENLRMFWQDLGRAMYVNRPSRLTPETIPQR